MKLKATITGKVHGVGYRVMLINMALEYGVDRFSAFNVKLNGKEAVVVLLDAPDEIAEILKSRIQTEKPEKAVVESITFEEYKYDVPPIERCMQAFQMEHWGRAIPILLDMLGKQDLMLEKQDRMLEKQDKMLGKMDLMLDKQDKMLEKQDMMLQKQDTMIEKQDTSIKKQDTVLGKMDMMLERQDATIKVIKEESEKTRTELGGKIDDLRSDLKEYMESNLR